MPKISQSKKLLALLKASSFLIFIGRAYQHLFWDAPFRVLLWDEQLFKPIVQDVFGVNWNHFVSSTTVDSNIQYAIKTQGVFYLVAAIISLLIKVDSKRWMRIILYIGGMSLIFLAFLLFKDRGYQLTMFFEHSIQFGSVFALLYSLRKPKSKKLLFYLKVLIALTFVSHGIYAMGILYPLPSNFVAMAMTLLPIPQNSVIHALFIMGIFDLIIAVLIFIPKLAKWALLYAFIWGILTAMARVTTGLYYDLSFNAVHQYLFESIYRLAHGLIPLAVLFSITNFDVDSKRF